MQLTADEQKVIEKIRKAKVRGFGEVVAKIKDSHIVHSSIREDENH